MIKTKQKRARGVRAKLVKSVPRLSVFRSNRVIYAQVIDDSQGKTIVYASATLVGKQKGSRTDQAREVGRQIAKKLVAKKVKKIVFDRGAYKYHGVVKALADGAREGGLEF